MSNSFRLQTVLTGIVVLVVVSSLFAGVASARSGIGGTTTVESGETVSSLSGVYGTIIIEGTVTGDVSGLAGDVLIREGGVVEGNLDVAAGSIRIDGTVQGSVSTGSGAVRIGETGVVQGTFDVGAGNVEIDGTIDGDVTIGADTIRLGDAATIGGSLTYDGDLQGNREAVQGTITRDSSINVGPGIFDNIQPFADFVFTLSILFLNFVLGALLLVLFPGFSERVADRVSTDPVRTGLVGLGFLIAVPLLLIAIAITIIGIPVALAGGLAFLMFVWIGIVYGRFALGYWLLSYTDVDNRWAALALGLVIGAALGQIPLLGGLVNFVIFLLGLGALVLGLYRRRGARRATRENASLDAFATE